MSAQDVSQVGEPAGPQYTRGQRLHCEQCGSEIEIISPCTCNPPDQVLQCCGRAMQPDTGKGTRVGVE